MGRIQFTIWSPGSQLRTPIFHIHKCMLNIFHIVHKASLNADPLSLDPFSLEVLFFWIKGSGCSGRQLTSYLGCLCDHKVNHLMLPDLTLDHVQVGNLQWKYLNVSGQWHLNESHNMLPVFIGSQTTVKHSILLFKNDLESCASTC